METNHDNHFAIQMHSFLERVRKEEISIEKKQTLYDIVQQLNGRTEKQKKRFLLYYGLMPNDYNKKINLCEIGIRDNCSANAVRFSIVRVKSSIAKIKDENTRRILLEISKE